MPLDLHARVDLCPGLEFLGRGRRLALIRQPGLLGAQPEEAAWRPMPFGAHVPADGIVPLLRSADILHLRGLLAREAYFVHRLDDHRVREAVAQLVRQGRLGLFERIEAEVPASPPLPAPAAPAPAPLAAMASPAERVTPSAWPGRAAPPPAAPVQAFVPPDPVQALDQDAQAAVLVKASSQGVPFCEECARRAALRKELEPA